MSIETDKIVLTSIGNDSFEEASSENSVLEIETRLRGRYNPKQMKSGTSKQMTYSDFIRVIRRLTLFSKNDKYTKMPVQEHLNISYTNIRNRDHKVHTRHSIPQSDISKYCLNPKNALEDATRILKFPKQPAQNLEFSDSKCNVKYEIGLLEENDAYPDEVNEIIRSESTYPLEQFADNRYMLKNFRNIKRYSFTTNNGNFQIDCSIVQQANGMSLQDAQIGKAPYKYEIEIEFNPLKRNLDLTREQFVKEYLEQHYFINQCLQNTLYYMPPSEELKVLVDYDKTCQLIREKVKRPINKKFIVKNRSVVLNAKPVSLNRKNSKIIKSGYSVTDKADGETKLLYIDSENRVCLLSMKSELTFTGITVDSKFTNTILVGEYIDTNREGQTCSQFMVFDAFHCPFFEGKIVAELPFHVHTESVEDGTTRLSVIKMVVEEIKDQTPVNNTIRIDFKTFKFADKEHTIYQLSKEVWDNRDSFDYSLDGLIYTPTKNPISFGTWKQVLKWKPPSHNSVDVLVRMVDKTESQVRLDFYYADNVVLRTSSNKKTDTVYKPLLFSSTVVNLDDNMTANDMDKKIIRNETVVECVFSDGEWKVMRSRPNKTAMYIKNREEKEKYWKWFQLILQNKLSETKSRLLSRTFQNFNSLNKMKKFTHTTWEECLEFVTSYEDIPIQTQIGINNKKVVEDITELSVSPIHEDELFTGIFKEIEKDVGVYYADDEGGTNVVISNRKDEGKQIRSYHNDAKRALIQNAVSLFKGQTTVNVLELACGKAGDMHKWFKAAKKNKLSLSIDAYDLSKTNLFDHADSAQNRWDEMKKKYGKNMTYTFAEHDVSTPIPNLEKKYSIVSCQFALHYFLKNEEMLTGFLNNVKNALVPGGVLVLSYPKGDKIIEYIQKNNNVDQHGYTLKSDDPLSLDKKYANKYEIHIPSTEGFIPEYLVDTEWFIQKLSDYGLSDISAGQNINMTTGEMSNGKPGFSVTLSDTEKTIAHLYETSIFKSDTGIGDDDTVVQ
tara:strand:+ start:1007 stop:4027 length:3021 start_codon:yes stop_codon:yes gene_type:complete